jgi:4-diphosphocytidyl-2-C-methyl-D-erythritol kinase
MAPSETVELLCPAKVNLALSVGPPVSTPRGMLHGIASWMVAVAWGDTLTVAPAGAGPSRFDLAYDPAAPLPGVIDWPVEKDLCYKAHALLQRHTGRDLPIRLTLRKRIPTGAGLGGGSSNAAGTLVGVNHLLDLGLPEATLLDLAAALGSDVPFLVGALLGRPSALVAGVGERLEALPVDRVLPLVLAFPGFACPTGAVYQQFDHRPSRPAAAPGPDLDRVRTLAATTPLPPDGPFNDLAEPACRVQPNLAEIVTRLASLLRLPVHVTGSGSTVFALCPDASAAQAAARKITADTGLAAVATNTLTA